MFKNKHLIQQTSISDAKKSYLTAHNYESALIKILFYPIDIFIFSITVISLQSG